MTTPAAPTPTELLAKFPLCAPTGPDPGGRVRRNVFAAMAARIVLHHVSALGVADAAPVCAALTALDAFRAARRLITGGDPGYFTVAPGVELSYDDVRVSVTLCGSPSYVRALWRGGRGDALDLADELERLRTAYRAVYLPDPWAVLRKLHADAEGALEILATRSQANTERTSAP